MPDAEERSDALGGRPEEDECPMVEAYCGSAHSWDPSGAVDVCSLAVKVAVVSHRLLR